MQKLDIEQFSGKNNVKIEYFNIFLAKRMEKLDIFQFSGKIAPKNSSNAKIEYIKSVC